MKINSKKSITKILIPFVHKMLSNSSVFQVSINVGWSLHTTMHVLLSCMNLVNTF